MELILIQHWLAGFGHVINLSVEIMESTKYSLCLHARQQLQLQPALTGSCDQVA